MRKASRIFVHSVCILVTISISHVTLENSVVGQYPAKNISNLNSSAPFVTSTSDDSTNCDFSSYPDFCIPYAPPNLNCNDVEGRDFTVFPPDPHGFDRDKDGEGCETSE